MQDSVPRDLTLEETAIANTPTVRIAASMTPTTPSQLPPNTVPPAASVEAATPGSESPPRKTAGK